MQENRNDIEDRIKQILITELEVAPDVVNESRSETPLLGRGIGIDSFEVLLLVTAIEKEFNVRVPDDELNAAVFENLAALSQFIIRKREEGNAA